MPPEPGRRSADRLLRHDRTIALNAARTAMSGWSERLAVAALLLLAAGLLHASDYRPRWLIAAGCGGIAGIVANRLLMLRLEFHGYDGLLAADALRPSARWRYAVAWHATGLLLLAAVTLATGQPPLLASLPAYLAGAAVGQGVAALDLQASFAMTRTPGRTLRSWLRHPRAGPGAAVILILLLPLAIGVFGNDAAAALAGIGTVLSMLALTGVDDAVVRFMTISGDGAWRIIARHARGAVLFAAVAAPVCALLFGPVVGAVVVAVTGAALLLLGLRVLSYRLYARRFADLLVMLLTGLLGTVAFVMPIILPVVVIGALWPLQRRAAARTWLLQ